MKFGKALSLALAAGVLMVGNSVFAQVEISQQASGVVTVKTPADTLRITVCSPTSVHVVASPDGSAEDATPKQPWLIKSCTPAKFTLTMPQATAAQSENDKLWNPAVATVDTGALKVRITLAWGTLEFQDEQGHPLLQEFQDAARRYTKTEVNGEQLYSVKEQFYPQVQEALYGLGQHQNGVFNYRGTVLELGQANTDVTIPLMLSTKGYGIFWNTAALSYFDNRFPSEMRFTSNASHAIDYYFIYGPEFDRIIHQYREMTGHAPLYGEWAYGFWQSKDRYRSDDELLKIAAAYRDAHVPLDNIVQDWFWWVHQGDPDFRPDAYPDVPGTLQKLHDEHVHAMISVWAIFDPQSKNFQQMKAQGLTIPGTTDYDATNPAAGDFYWRHLIGKLFAQGWDGFWLDSSEPEAAYLHGGESDAELYDKRLHIGNGALYTNVFPLMHTGNIYTHWRDTTILKRVFILTRSGFAGDQRYAATTWSGDVFSTWQAFARQVPAGLNFALSGMPYWTTDIAGYGPPYARDTHDPAYEELYTRWYEFGVFCPIFRTHGHRANNENELFSYGAATATLVDYDRLRYRLLPYIYSLAWNVTNDDGTMMRPLVMDWRTDEKVWNIGDEFMFGPALLVSPVTEEGATEREVYLPAAARWYDFWTGKSLNGEQRIAAAAPVGRIPLYVKAGAIVPMGPEIEYAQQKPDAPIELRVYRGADGHFDLYEDRGDTYNYEKGERAVIPIDWNDALGTLTIGARAGSYAGMPEQRRFNVVFVGENHGAGGAVTATADQSIEYSGAAASVRAK
ncbi:MAG TPA: TIM-barrel domain-containing protein [Silvibacterium sp.]|nr:TIM-barrel domain-containing protein [Silvibacterium sp.]